MTNPTGLRVTDGWHLSSGLCELATNYIQETRGHVDLETNPFRVVGTVTPSGSAGNAAYEVMIPQHAHTGVVSISQREFNHTARNSIRTACIT